MGIIRVAGFDPSLRNTGYGILNYDEDREELWPSHCGIIRTPVKITGTDAIVFMIESIYELANLKEIKECDYCVIESPAAIFYSGMSSGGLIPVAHVAGACAAILSIRQGSFNASSIKMVRPVEWNRRRKKEKTHEELVSLFGPLSQWEYHCKPKSHGKIKNDDLDKRLEHIVDAIGMALWFMQSKFFTINDN